jgi:hypothetical protein
MPLNIALSKSADVHTIPLDTTASCPLLTHLSDSSKADRNVRVRKLIQELEQGLGYKGATSGDDLEGLMRGMRMQADETGIAYPQGSNAYRAFTFGVSFTHVRALFILWRAKE